MSEMSVTLDRPAPSRLRIFRLEARYEFLKLWRMPSYVIPANAFPLMFYLLFGVALGSQWSAGGVDAATYLLATYGVFGVMGATFFGLGVGLAVERGQGWMLLKRAMPMPLGVHLLGRVVVGLAFASMLVLALFALGATAGGVRLATSSWLALAAVLVSGGIPFAACGMALGFWSGPNSAPAVINLIYLPMAFASGLWIPVDYLPSFFRNIAPFLPPYHHAQLALGALGGEMRGSAVVSVAVLVGFTLLCLVLAAAGFRRDDGKTYG